MSNIWDLQRASREHTDELAKLERERREKKISQLQYEVRIVNLKSEYQTKTNKILESMNPNQIYNYR